MSGLIFCWEAEWLPASSFVVSMTEAAQEGQFATLLSQMRGNEAPFNIGSPQGWCGTASMPPSPRADMRQSITGVEPSSQSRSCVWLPQALQRACLEARND